MNQLLHTKMNVPISTVIVLLCHGGVIQSDCSLTVLTELWGF